MPSLTHSSRKNWRSSACYTVTMIVESMRASTLLLPPATRKSFIVSYVYVNSLLPLCNGSEWDPKCLPKGDQGCLMSSCLESQGCHLIPLYYLLSCSFAKSCYSFCFILFLPAVPFSWLFFQKILQYFSLRERLFFFLYGSCLEAGRSKLVGGMCSMLPYGTGICCHAFI